MHLAEILWDELKGISSFVSVPKWLENKYKPKYIYNLIIDRNRWRIGLGTGLGVWLQIFPGLHTFFNRNVSRYCPSVMRRKNNKRMHKPRKYWHDFNDFILQRYSRLTRKRTLYHLLSKIPFSIMGIAKVLKRVKADLPDHTHKLSDILSDLKLSNFI